MQGAVWTCAKRSAAESGPQDGCSERGIGGGDEYSTLANRNRGLDPGEAVELEGDRHREKHARLAERALRDLAAYAERVAPGAA